MSRLKYGTLYRLARYADQLAINFFEEERRWETAFKATRRRNGKVIPAGRIRDAIDTGNTVDNIEVSMSKTQISVAFQSDDIHRVLAGRPDLEELLVETMMDQIGEEFAVLIVIGMLRR